MEYSGHQLLILFYILLYDSGYVDLLLIVLQSHSILLDWLP